MRKKVFYDKKTEKIYTGMRITAIILIFFCFSMIYGGDSVWAATTQLLVQSNTAVTSIVPAQSNTPISTVKPLQSITPTITPAPEQTPKPTSASGITTTPAQTKKKKQSIGWHRASSGKKYYICKNKKKAKGFVKIGGREYFFSKAGYMQTEKWKYKKINGKRYKIYFGKKGYREYDVTKFLPKNVTFLLKVNVSKNIVMVYAKDGKKGYDIPVKAMICSAGMPGHSTKLGTYRLSRVGQWHVLKYNCYGRYCTRYSGPYMFHSVVYDRYGDKYSLQKDEYNKLGKCASHGCIRLQTADAKWIYDRAYRITVHLYKSSKEKYPVKKPKKKKIGKKNGKYYDTTQ